MSYLMDALRKAERERNLGRVPDAVNNEFATGYIPAGRRWHWLPVLLAVLILLNLGLLTAFWLSNRGNPAPSSGVSQAPVQPAPQPASTPAPVAKPAAPAPAERTATPQPEPAPAPAVPEPARDEAAAPVPSPAPSPAPAAVEPFELEADEPHDEPVPSWSALSASQKARIPAHAVNGHLYSSIPGRSFVLLNGRRYNEGQRTAEGPAVVFIDEAGAVLDFEGLRYRIDAPR